MIKRIIYVIFTGVIFFYLILYESYIFAVFVSFMVALPFVFLAVLYSTKKRLKIKQVIPKDIVYKGEYIPIVLEINNGSIFPIVMMRIEVECTNELYNTTKKEIFDIPTLKIGKQSFTFSMKSSYCGNIKIKLNKIRIADYLGLFYLNKYMDLEKTIPIIPEIRVIECENVPQNLSIMIDGDVFSKNKKGDDPSEVFDIREYREGDELHSIHWKLSAKKDDIYVKELSYPLNSGIVILMDMSFQQGIINLHKYVDSIIETVLSISMRLQELGYIHHIVWYDESANGCSVFRVNENTHLNEITLNMYRSHIYQDDHKMLKAYNRDHYENEESHIYYVTSHFDKKNIEYLKNSRENAMINYVYVVSKEEDISKDSRAYIEANDINIHFVEYNNLSNTIGAFEF